MKTKELRLLLSSDIHKKYKIQCVQNEISMPKQTQELILKFLDMSNQNKGKVCEK